MNHPSPSSRQPGATIAGSGHCLGHSRALRLVHSLALASAILITAHLAVGPASAGDPLDHWESRYPDAAASYFAHGGGQWLGFEGVGGIKGSGRILRSGDGTVWRSSEIPSDFVPFAFGDGAAAFGAELWVVLGQTGTNFVDLFSAIFTSADGGETWHRQTSGLDLLQSLGVDPELRIVAHGGGLWVAMGRQGRYLTSSDGLTWTPRVLPGTPHGAVYSVSHGNAQWMVLTAAGIFLSPDGIKWVPHENQEALVSARFAEGQWIGLTDSSFSTQRIMSSSDGAAWKERAVAGILDDYQRIAHGGGLWLVVGVALDEDEGFETRVTQTSADGVNWQRHHTSGEVPPPRSLSHGGGMWFLSAGSGSLLTSSDGTNWSARAAPGFITAMEIAGGVHVAVGTTDNDPEFGAVVWGSPNGWTWAPGEIAGAWRGGSLHDVAYGGGRWVAVGMEYGPPAFQGVVLTSGDGLNWTPVLTAGPLTAFSGVAYGAGRWNVVGGGSEPLLFTSQNSVDWTPQPLAFLDEPWEWLEFSNGIWLAGRNPQGSLVHISTDGITWAPLQGSARFHDAHFADGQWMAVSSRNLGDGSSFPTTLRSLDGINWSAQDLDLPLASEARFRSITHAAGRWIIAGSGRRDGRSNALIWSSANGTNWQEHRVGTGDVLHSPVTSDGRRVFLAGSFGIRASGRLLPAAAPTLHVRNQGGNAPFLQLQGEGGERYDIEFSPDLKPGSWSIFGQMLPGSNGQQTAPFDPLPGGQGFWRIRW